MILYKRFDWWLLFSIFAIFNLGLLTQLSIVPDLFGNQLFFIGIGVIFFLFFTFIDVRIFFSLKYLIYFLACLSLLLTGIFGETVRGSARWLSIFGIVIQPSEIFKPFIIIFIAGFLSGIKNLKKIIILSLFLFPLIILILKQPDLGNVIIYLTVFLFLLLIEKYYKILITVFLVFSLLTPVFWNVLHDYQRQRIVTFLNPNLDPQGTGYNALQSTISVGSGGFLGKGLGKGTQSHLHFLPEKHTDFVFASFAEEFGFLGSLILILLYLLLLFRILLISQICEDKRTYLLCLGIMAMFLAQIIINIGMNIGILPITGITLPLFSYGGSSILSSFIALGMIQSISLSLKKNDPLEIR